MRTRVDVKCKQAKLLSFRPVRPEKELADAEPVIKSLKSSAESSGKKKDKDTCVAPNKEGLQASLFLRMRVFTELESLGYDHFMRFSQDSALSGPVSDSLFQQMRLAGQTYAFKGLAKDDPACTKGLWDLARAICSGSFDSGTVNVPASSSTLDSSSSSSSSSNSANLQIGSTQKKFKNVFCADSFEQWTEDVSFLTHFEAVSLILKSLYFYTVGRLFHVKLCIR